MTDDPSVRSWYHAGHRCLLWEQDGQFHGVVLAGTEPIATTQVLHRFGEERAREVVEALVPVMARRVGIWDRTDAPIIDVVLVPRGTETDNDEGRLAEPFQLLDDVVILPGERVPADLIRDACDPPGLNRTRAIDLRGKPLYAIVRENPPTRPHFGWDPDDRLQLCIVLSRLIHPTSISLEYAVRIIGDVRDRPEILPGPVRGDGASAWTPYPDRNWLTREEMTKWQELARAFFANPIPPRSRLQQVMWFFEYAARTYTIDMRIPMLVTAAEGLITTDPEQSTRHFTKRLPLLAARLGVTEFDQASASKVWGLRGQLVHGARHGGLAQPEFELFRRLERVLRETLRHAILDETLRRDLSSPAAVESAFPLPTRPPRLGTCPACRVALEVPRAGALRRAPTASS